MTTGLTERDTVVIGGGQSGLTMSYLLTEQDRDHVVLEKSGRIGETWRNRWDSFTLVTPRWQLQLPGHEYDGDDPDGFAPRDEVVEYLEDYAAAFDPPIRFGVTVTGVEDVPDGVGYVVRTTEGDYRAQNVVVAVGTFQQPAIPSFADDVPADVTQLHSSDYRNPDQLPEGAVLVVGSGQSGCQIAQELHEAGRTVHLCTGRVGRIPRRYRGRDGMWWAMQLGMVDRTVDQLDSPAERFAPNPQISGKDGGREIDLHQFARDGIRLLGHLEGIEGRTAVVAPDLHDNIAGADEMLDQFRTGVDTLVEETGMDVPEPEVDDPKDGYDQEIVTELDLDAAGISTIIWATGYRWNFDWVDAPVFDDYGYPIQERGVTDRPGLYFVGLHWLHTLKSGLFLGVGGDAANVAEHIADRRAQVTAQA